MEVTQKGWFMMENPTVKIRMIWGVAILEKTSICIWYNLYIGIIYIYIICIYIYTIYIYTLWLFNIAMENGPFIDGLPIKNGGSFHGKLLNNQRVYYNYTTYFLHCWDVFFFAPKVPRLARPPGGGPKEEDVDLLWGRRDVQT